MPDCDTTLDEASAVSYTPEAIGFIKTGSPPATRRARSSRRSPRSTTATCSRCPPEAEAGRRRSPTSRARSCARPARRRSTSRARRSHADQAVHRRRIAAGDTKSEIKDKLVAEFGPQILAAPPKHGFDLLAWLLPFVGLVGGRSSLGFLAWRWSRAREPAPPAPASSPELERRVDEELARFDEG